MPRHYRFCPMCASPLRRRRERHGEDIRPICDACGFVHYDNPAPCAGVLILNRKNQVLLGKRAYKPHQGCWDIVGGFIEKGEHPEEAARREAFEETGLRIHVVRLLGIWMDRYGRSREHTLNLIYLAGVDATSGPPQAGDDVKELKWFDIQEVPETLVAFSNGQMALRRLKEIYCDTPS